MVDQTEKNNENSQSEIQQRIAQIDRQIEAARQADRVKGTSANAENSEQRTLARQFLEAVKKTIDRVKNFVASPEKKSDETLGKSARNVLVEAGRAVKKNIQVSEDPKVQAFLKDCEDRAPDELTAIHILDKIGDFLTGEKKILFSKKDQEATDFEKAIKRLTSSNRAGAERIIRVVEKQPEVFNIERDQVDRLKIEQKPVEVVNDSVRRLIEGERTLTNWDREKEVYEGKLDDKQMKLVQSLYNPHEFVEYLETRINPEKDKNDEVRRRINLGNKQKAMGEYKKRMEKANRLVTEASFEKEWHKLVSHEVAAELNSVMDNVFISLQRERPKKFFQDIAQSDFWKGIRITLDRLNRAVDQLSLTISSEERKGFDYKMYKDMVEESDVEERVIMKNGKSEIKRFPRIHILASPEKVKLSDYIISLKIVLSHAEHEQEYLHNARTLYNHPPGEGGFYGQLGKYAEDLTGTDINEMFLMPDADKVAFAFNLYTKLTEEEYALHNWQHTSDQDVNKMEWINTQVEDQTVERMKEFYPDFPESRVRGIVNKAVGIAKGVFLNTIEMGAYADPVDPKGGGHFASYSTQDAAIFMPFNPLHLGMRWQHEGVKPLIYFLPMDAKSRGAELSWDHNKLSKMMQKYHDSYMSGRKEVGDAKLFIDGLTDVCKIGGIFKRRGWRAAYELEDYFVWDKGKEGKDMPKNENSKDVKVLETWKIFEKIGYEAISYFTDYLTGTDTAFIKAGSDDKTEFYKYLYKKYFPESGEEKNDGDFNQYMKELRSKGREKAIESIKNGKSPSSLDEQIEEEVGKLFLYRVLAREVTQRFPTKILRVSRDRFEKNGKSRWTAIWEEMKEKKYLDPNLKLDPSKWDANDFDKIMRDLNLVESVFRSKMSKEIKDHLEMNPDDKKWNFQINDRLSERLDEIFKELNWTDFERANKVKYLYTLIEKKYINDEFLDNTFAGFLRNKEYPFSFGVEETDLSLLSFRKTGPRLIPRAIGDIGQMERDVIPGILGLRRMLQDMSVNGKKDLSPLLQYLKKAQKAFLDIHGPGEDYEFVYKIAAMTITYFKKDTMAKPLFGIFGLGRKNSVAAEYAGRSSGVWEWDSRDIDRFIVALESNDLLKNNPYDLAKYDLAKKATPENIWLTSIPILDKIPFLQKFAKLPIPIKTPFKKRHVDYAYNTKKLRQEFGGNWKDIAWDYLNQILPLVFALIFMQYLKAAFKENEGKK